MPLERTPSRVSLARILPLRPILALALALVPVPRQLIFRALPTRFSTVASTTTSAPLPVSRRTILFSSDKPRRDLDRMRHVV